MRKKELLSIELCQPPKRKKEECLLKAQVVKVKEYDVLNVDIYKAGELAGRYFAHKYEKRHLAVVFEESKERWSEARLENVIYFIKTGEFSVYHQSLMPWETKEDEKTANHYMEGGAITRWEYELQLNKKLDAWDRKVQRINSIMDKVEPISKDMDEWLKNKIFPEQYLFCERTKKGSNYQCTCCGQKGWIKEKVSHNESRTCPKCKQKVIVKTRTKEIKRKEKIYALQTYDGKEEWIERVFKAYTRWSAGKKTISLMEDIRVIIPQKKTFGKVYYGQYQEADELKQDWWTSNPYNKRWSAGYLYPQNLKEVLTVAGIEHCGLDIIAEKQIKINVNNYILAAEKRPYMEYMLKKGLYRLARDITEMPCYMDSLKAGEKKLTNLLKIDGNCLNRMVEVDAGWNLYKWIKYEKESEVKIGRETLEYLNRKNISKEMCERILECIKSPNKMVNYLKKQKNEAKSVLQTWEDYIRMAEQEGYDITDSIVAFPKDLRQRHQQMIEIRNARRDEDRLRRKKEEYAKLDKEIACRLSKIKKFFWQDENYSIIPAARCEELIREGRALHHCVGASDIYMKRMAKGESWILFLRKKEDLKRAYYTIEIEVESHKIRQYYSEFDRKPDLKEVNRVLEKFKKRLRASTKKEERKLLIAPGA